MLRNLKLIPNQVTAVRLVITFILWGMLIFGSSSFFGIGIGFCLLSDILDGQIARRLHQTTEFGARFDSLADNILIPSALIWLFILHREVYLDHPILWSVAIMAYISSLISGWAKVRKFDVSQLYLSKLSGLTMYLFGIHTFITGGYNAGLFYLMMGIFLASFLESLILQFMRAKIDEHLTSIVFAWGPFKRYKPEPLANLLGGLFRILYGAHPSTPKNEVNFRRV